MYTDNTKDAETLENVRMIATAISQMMTPTNSDERISSVTIQLSDRGAATVRVRSSRTMFLSTPYDGASHV